MALGLQGSSAGAGAGPVVGTYTGTGSAVTLTFDEAPKSVIIVGSMSAYSPVTASGCWAIWINGLGRYANESVPAKWVQAASGNTLSINEAKLIQNNVVYNYIAFF